MPREEREGKRGERAGNRDLPLIRSSPKLKLASGRPMEAKQWIFEECRILVGRPKGLLLPLIPALHIRRKVGHSRGKGCGVVNRLGRRRRVEIVLPIDLRYFGGRVGAVGPVSSGLARVEVTLPEEALDDAVDVDPVRAGGGHCATATAHFDWLHFLAACVVLAIPGVSEVVVAKLLGPLGPLGMLLWLLFTRPRGWFGFECVVGEVVYHDAVFAHESVDNHGCFLHC